MFRLMGHEISTTTYCSFQILEKTCNFVAMRRYVLQLYYLSFLSWQKSKLPFCYQNSLSVANRKFGITSAGGGSLNDYRRVTGRLVAVGGQQASGPLLDGMCLAMQECAASRSEMIAGGRVLVVTALLVSTLVWWLSCSAGSVFQCVASCGQGFSFC